MISQTGFWNFSGCAFDREHVYDQKLSDALVVLAKRLGVTKSYDFGCGPGKYVENFRKNGIEAVGFDGNPTTINFRNCVVQDLTSTFQEPSVDFLISLEVCEHVPKKHEEALLDTFGRHLNPGGTIVISWAVVGQRGTGHINCQNNDYVIQKFVSMGYIYKDEESKTLRQNVSECAPWFLNTTLVFQKK